MTNYAKLAVPGMIFPFAAFAQPALPPPVQTSAEDCAAMAVTLQPSLFDLGGFRGDMFNMSEGSYGVDCDWKALGVEAPRITSVKSGAISGSKSRIRRITRDQATWTDGHGVWLATGYCEAEKNAGKWQRRGCDIGMYFGLIGPERAAPIIQTDVPRPASLQAGACLTQLPVGLN